MPKRIIHPRGGMTAAEAHSHLMARPQKKGPAKKRPRGLTPSPARTFSGKEALRRKWENFLQESMKKARGPFERRVVVRWRDLFNTLVEFKGTPDATQVASAMALQHGLRELREQVNAAVAIERNYPKMKTWEGSLHGLAKALRKDLPFRIEKILRGSGRIISSKDLARRLSCQPASKYAPVSWNREDSKLINYSCRLLEHAGFIREEAPHSQKTGTQILTWSHAVHEALPIRHTNVRIKILELAAARETTVPEISRKSGITAGSIIKNSRALRQKGYLEIRRQKLNGNLTILLIRLTPKGIKLAENLKKSSEELRQASY